MSHFLVLVAVDVLANKTLDQVMLPFHEYESTGVLDYTVELTDEDGEPYRTNPNAKWDWYSVGGRWREPLLTLDGETVSEAQARDMDWDAMHKRTETNLRKEYREFHQALKQAEGMDLDLDRARDTYENWVKRYDHVDEVFGGYLRFAQVEKAFNLVDEYPLWSLNQAEKLLTLNEEEYSQPTAISYAFIDLEGRWHQRGEMGWWGMDDPSKATEAYDAEFWRVFQNLPGHVWVYAVDCHI